SRSSAPPRRRSSEPRSSEPRRPGRRRPPCGHRPRRRRRRLPLTGPCPAVGPTATSPKEQHHDTHPAPATHRRHPTRALRPGRRAPSETRYEAILTPEALRFLALLHDRFAPRRSRLLTARATRREAISGGAMFDSLPETAALRDDPTWRVAGAGPGLEDRRV